MLISKKVILLGKFGVGKTSLIKRFVFQKFSEEYQTTIGVKVDKKILNIHGVELNMLSWDIAGETSSMRVPQSYKLGAHGVLYVFDVTRPSSYDNIQKELQEIGKLLPGVPVQVVGNKIDLLGDVRLQKFRASFFLEGVIYASAKEDVQVEEAFERLGKAILQ